jgi:hypothetical protein
MPDPVVYGTAADDGSVADRVSEILKCDEERAQDIARRLCSLGIQSARQDLKQWHLTKLYSIGLSEMEAIKLRARWIPDAGKTEYGAHNSSIT